jgi:hypothetical protein
MASVTWTIVGQQATTGQDAAGDYQKGVDVTFQLATGTTGTVFIPQIKYTPENVAVAVTKAARHLNAVDNLTGSV